jgi:hypothetical protein
MSNPAKAFMVLAVVVGATSTSAAQSAPTTSQQTCPVSIVNVNPRSAGAALMAEIFTNKNREAKNHFIAVRYKNDSDKTLAGIKFAANSIDATLDKHLLPETHSGKSGLKPGKEESGSWKNIWDDDDVDRPQIEVFVVKVLFSDGTTWTDDGSQSCSLTSSKK